MSYMSKNYLIATGVLLFSLAALAQNSECDQVAGNLVDNCGWETGCWHAWYGNLFIDVGGGEVAHSGDWGGIVHAHNDIEYIGQSLSTVVGQAYTLSFWMRNTQPVDRLQIEWNDGDVVEIPLDLENVPAQGYTQIVVPDLIATSNSMAVIWALSNSLSDIDFDDVVVVPQNE